MADRRYKLLKQGLPGARSFEQADLADGDVPYWDAAAEAWGAQPISIQPDTLYWTGFERVTTHEYGAFIHGDAADTITYMQLLNNADVALMNVAVTPTQAYLYSYQHGIPVNIYGEDAGGVSRLILSGDPDGASNMYYAGTRVLATRATNSVTLYSNSGASSAILYFDANGAEGRMYESPAGDLYIDNIYSGGDIFIQTYNGSGLETGISIIEGGAVNLYYDGAARANTTTYGFSIGNSGDKTPDSSGNGHLKINGNGYAGFITLNASHMHIGTNSASRGVAFNVDETVTAFFDGNRMYLKHIGGTSPYIDFRGSNDVQDMYIQSSGDLAYYWRGFNNGSYFYIAGDNAGGTHQAVIIADPDNYTDIYAAGYLGIRVGNATLGFFNATGNAKQTITGSRGGNAALANLLAALSNHGLITNSTT